MGRGLCLELSRRDRHQLDELLSGGLQPVRTVLRALALRQMDDGQSTPAVGVSLGLSAKAWTSCPARLRIQAMRNRQRVLRRRAQGGTALHQGDADALLSRVRRLPAE